MKIGLSLMAQVWEDKPANLNICKKLAEKASKNGVKLLIFPEMTLTGFSSNITKISEEINTSKSLSDFADIASECRINIIAGLVLKTNNAFHNCAIAIDEKGKQLGCYAKIHPFSLSGENQNISKGDELVIFDLDGLRIGLTICYDLRFPILWSALSDKCDCIINIANWPANRVDHWYSLLKARAIENQVVVIGVNRIGIDVNQLKYLNSSIAYFPDGNEFMPVFSSDDINVVDIDISGLKKYQASFPVREDRRKDLYKKFLNEW